jgi:hypothetical protein
MPKGWTCPSCEARNTWLNTECDNCGRAKPEAGETAATDKQPRRCPIDGGDLRADGLCLSYTGYPEGMSCPIVCPTCHGKLAWSGVCYSSHAAADRVIPGDRYELHKGHWVVVEKGPRPMFTPEQNQRAIRIVARVYKGEISEAEGHRLIDAITREKA